MKNKTNIVSFTGVSSQKTPPNQVLDSAIDKLESVFIVGYDKEGNEYFASSESDGADALWLLKRAEKFLLSIPELLEEND